MNFASLSKYQPYTLSVLRIVTALLFMLHGTQKMFAFPVGRSPGTVDYFSLMGLAGTLEVVGGLAVLLGLFTRPVAFVLSGLAAFAYWMGHAPRDLFPVNNGGDAAILFCFVFLYLVFAGPGPLSLDETLKSRRSAVAA